MYAKELLRSLQRVHLDTVRIPDTLIPTSLVEENVDIWMAAGSSLRWGNTKAFTGLALLLGAEKRGELEGKHTLVEATSGNTGKILAAMAQHFNCQNTVLVMEPDVPYAKRFPGIAHGAKILPPEDGLTAIDTARLWGKRDGWINLDQYRNTDGLELHRLITGPQILTAIGEAPTAFAAAIGAGTTVGGTAEYLRARGTSEIFGVLLEDDEEAPGMRDEPGMEQIQLPWRTYIDKLVKVQARESYYASLCLTRATGISFGPTSGSAYIGALKGLWQHQRSGTLDLIRNNKTGRICVAVIGPDGYEPYGDRYDARVHRKHSKPGMLPLPWKFFPQDYHMAA